jgi:hypothetical protein
MINYRKLSRKVGVYPSKHEPYASLSIPAGPPTLKTEKRSVQVLLRVSFAIHTHADIECSGADVCTCMSF